MASNRKDLVVKRGHRTLTAEAKWDLIQQADQWRRTALKRLRTAVETGKNIEPAKLALGCVAARRHQIGFSTRDLEFYVNREVAHLYTGWTDRDGKPKESLEQVCARKKKQRADANEKLSRGINKGKQGDLHAWRNKLTEDLQSIEAHMKTREQFVSLLQEELESR